MVYPQHWLLQFGGHQGDPLEQWSCGIRLAVQSLDPQEGVNEEAYLDSTAIPALTAWFTGPSSLIANAAKLIFIKFNEIGPDGRYADQSTTHQRFVNVSGAGGATNLHPLQVALVLSWRTNAALRGPASHGRIYSPRPAVSVDALGDVAGPQRVGAAVSAATLLNSLDTALGIIGGVLRPSIVSALGSGTVNQIDSVVVDSSLDVQRRRSFTQSKEITGQAVVYS